MSSVNSSKQMNQRIAGRLGLLAIVAALVLTLLLGPIATIQPVKADDGDVDTTYGVNGRAVLPTPYNSAYPRAAIQPDGKMVVAYDQFDLTTDTYALVVVRLLPNGELDTFGSWPTVVLFTGSIILGIKYSPVKVCIRPDGKILVAFKEPEGTSAVLLNANGTIDTSFSQDGVDGKIFLGSRIWDLVVLPDNGFVTLGGARLIDIGGRLKGYSANGSHISSRSIVFPTGVTGDCRRPHLAATPDGRIIVSTTSWGCSSDPEHSLLMRYNADLTLDASFCGGSMCVIPARVNIGIEVASDGKIVGMADGVALRRLPDGGVDSSFGDAGRFTLSALTPIFFPTFTVDSHGRILVKNTSSPSQLWVLAEDGSIAEEYTPASPDLFGAQEIIAQEDGKVIVVYHQVPFLLGFSNEPVSLVRLHYDDHRTADLRFANIRTTRATSYGRGDEIEYVIRVVNHGPDRAGHLTFENPVPNGTDFVSFVAPDGWVTYQRPHLSRGKVSCSAFSLESGQTATFRLTLRVKANVARGSQIENTSYIQSLVSDSVRWNNTKTTTVAVE